MKWGMVPIGLVFLAMAWMAWNIDNPADNEVIVDGLIVDVQANAPTVEYSDLSLETATIVGEREDQPPRIGDGREVVLSTDGTAEPRLRNTNPAWMVILFGVVALLFVLGPFAQTLWRLMLRGGAVLGGGWLAKRASDAVPESTGGGSMSTDIETLRDATKEVATDESTRSAGKEVAGAVLIAEGVAGIDNPFSSRSRGGLYSSIIGALAGIGLFLYAPIVGVLLTGEPDDIRVEGTVVEWTETTRRNDEGELVTSWNPTYRYSDAATGIDYFHKSGYTAPAEGSIGEIAEIAYDPTNPSSAIVVQPWGKRVALGIRAFAGLLLVIAATTFALRAAALAAGFYLLRAGRKERRARGDNRSTLTVVRDSATAVIDNAASEMPEGSRGGLLSTLVAVRRQGRGSDTVHAAKDVVGATVLVDSLFGLERPFDGEHTRLGIFGNLLLTALFVFLAVFGVWLGNQMGYVGDRSTSPGSVVEVEGRDATIEFVDETGRSWSIVVDDSERLVGQQVRVVYDAEAPEVAQVVSRGAGALRWLLLGAGVLGVLGLLPTLLMQAAGIVLGLGLLIGLRR